MLADSFQWFTLWLILHILTVIVAFGPTATFGLITALGRKNPQHMSFAVEVVDVIERKMTIPLAVLVPLFGTALIFTAKIDLWKSEWLIIAIVLYTITFAFAVFVQTKNSARMLHLLSTPPAPGASGPPPEAAALGRKLQMGGIFLSIMVVVILVLMVWRPGNCQGC